MQLPTKMQPARGGLMMVVNLSALVMLKGHRPLGPNRLYLPRENLG